MNSVKEVDIKNRTDYFFDVMIKKVKTDGMSFKNNLIYQNGYVMVKGLSYTTINIVNPLYLIINKKNACIEENRGNEYLMLFLQVKANQWKMHEEIWDKIRNLIWSVTNNSDNYAEKFNLAGNLPLWKIGRTL